MHSSDNPHILIADDHAMMRDGMVLMIQTAWPACSCAVAQDYLGVVAQLDSQNETDRFDAIVLDLRMPGMRGAESVAQITKLAKGTPVIVCTALEDPSLVERLMTCGIFCAVNKTTGADELLKHIRLALQKQAQTLDSTAQRQPVQTPSRVSGTFHQSGSAMLTSRQREILKLLHTGKPSKVIATQLGVGLGTIKSHLHTLYSVMDVSNRSEAIVKSQGWLL